MDTITDFAGKIATVVVVCVVQCIIAAVVFTVLDNLEIDEPSKMISE